MTNFGEFAAYQAWANTITLNALNNTKNETANRVFAHLLGANLVWGSRLAGTQPDCEVAPSWGLEECEVMIGRITELYNGLPTHLSEQTVIHYTTSTGTPSSSSVAQIMMQLWAHNAYHRGEIAGYIRQQGGVVMDTDYIIYARSHA